MRPLPTRPTPTDTDRRDVANLPPPESGAPSSVRTARETLYDAEKLAVEMFWRSAIAAASGSAGAGAGARAATAAASASASDIGARTRDTGAGAGLASDEGRLALNASCADRSSRSGSMIVSTIR